MIRKTLSVGFENLKHIHHFADIHIRNFHWFVFNVADIFITVGIIGLLTIELLKKEKISKNV